MSFSDNKFCQVCGIRVSKVKTLKVYHCETCDPNKASKKSGRKKRECLSCNRKFESKSAINRVCPDCKRQGAWSGDTESSLLY